MNVQNVHGYTVAFQHSRTDIFSCVKKLYKPQVIIIDRGISKHELFTIFSHNKKTIFFLKLEHARCVNKFCTMLKKAHFHFQTTFFVSLQDLTILSFQEYMMTEALVILTI